MEPKREFDGDASARLARVFVGSVTGSAALVENGPNGLFATVNAFTWLTYFLWIAALSIALIRARDTPTTA